ncbi:MAG TPA: hypothetical protein VHB20_11700, partial [Verrucomicrobiae bacterium]|nr:hypothetical protein [Verrucomicrobiae bacterium]
QGGALVGWVNFTGDSANAIATNSTIAWFNEAGATTLYSGGFTGQGTPMASLYDSTLSDLLSFSSGTVILSGGNLTDTITNTVTISGNTVFVDPSATNSLTLTIDRPTGEILGTFVYPPNHTNFIDSVILQNSTNAARGYFLGTSEGGAFLMFGN